MTQSFKYSINASFKRGASLVAQMVKRLLAMWETRVQSLGWEDPLEQEMTTHSITLASKIPWTEEPGRLYSVGLQRVGRDWDFNFHFSREEGSFLFLCLYFVILFLSFQYVFTCSDPITAFFAVAWSWLLLFVARIERGFPGHSVGKSACNSGEAGDLGSIPGWGRSPRGEHGNSPQYPCLKNLMDREACGLQSIGSQTVRHHWSDWARMHAW